MMNDIAHMIASIDRLTLGRWNIVSSSIAPSGTFYVRHSRFAYLPKRLETESVQSSDTRLVKIVDVAIPFTYTSTMACERDVR
jgi:hypothetical protein